MKRTEFERVTPEAVGISSKAIGNLLDKLENGGYTEPHGLMIMRHNKVCAEGWWSPYAPGMRHGLQSHTKTYAATAVGIAYTEGILKLDERIIDIFPDEAPENPSENLKKLTVHHVLCMGCGMDEMPRPSVDWIRDFLAIPVNHEPGTTYMYNSTGSTLLGAIVRKKTGLGLHDYLKPRLFDKIGIDADNLRWLCMPDGMEIGGGGLYATTEDNLRLIKLYADGGVWNGERILAEDYVKKATALQNESATEEKVNPPAKDNFVGYGYQIWMCRPKGVYRADGAMGQFSIVVPDKDMIIAITENASGSTGGVGPQKVLDAMWEFLDEITSDKALPEDEASDALKRRMAALAIPNPAFAPFAPQRPVINGKKFKVTEGVFTFGDAMLFMMGGGKMPAGIEEFTFSFSSYSGRLDFVQEGKASSIEIALDGSRTRNIIGSGAATIALVSGAWISSDTFRLTLRWIETTSERIYDFKFSGNDVTISPVMTFFFGRKPEDAKATMA
jgi:CubicO group peptidase (beta-lactamase class C family)